MSDQDAQISDGALEVAQEPVDPFTKIPFHPREGIMAFSPIRPGILKEIDPVTTSPDASVAAH
jgi:hypothetical protein